MTTNKFVELVNVTAVMKSDNQLLVLGVPDEDDETHNCDAMGCSSVEHVLFRCNIPYVGDSVTTNGLDIQAIRERVNKATPGSWKSTNGFVHIGHDVVATARDNDAQFIAHARTDIPALLGEIERLQGLLFSKISNETSLAAMMQMYANPESWKERKFVRAINHEPWYWADWVLTDVGINDREGQALAGDSIPKGGVPGCTPQPM